MYFQVARMLFASAMLGGWTPMNISMGRSYPIPKRVSGKKAWKKRGKVPSKHYRKIR